MAPPNATAPQTVNGARLLVDLGRLATVGATPEGGVNRPAYSDEDIEARDVVRDWMRLAGLAVRVDAAGNTIARMPGGPSSGSPIVIGSHTDTVPNGGRFDGALGVLAAIEVARTLIERGVSLLHPLDVVNFQNEEGGLVGSRAVAGRLDANELHTKATSGRTLGDGIKRLGGDPARLSNAVMEPGSIAAYVELHIEQGRFLERSGTNIGIVEGIVGIRYWEVTFDGVASHAGTTPMADRHDALLAAARFIEAVHRVVTREPGRHVGTVGRINIAPGAPNVIPGRATVTLELRDLDPERIAVLFAAVSEEARRIAGDLGTLVSLTPAHGVDPSPTDPGVRRAIAASAAKLGLTTMHMPSGAGHDTQNMARIGPAGMLFVPSVDGISHSPRERTHDHDVVNGASVLLGAVLNLDRTTPRSVL